MEYLSLPILFERGAFKRTGREEALSQYVALFFASRKNEAHPALDFGLDLDDVSWISSDDYLRILVDEFNRVHRGSMSLLIEEKQSRGDETLVGLGLRCGRDRYRIRMEMGNILGA